MYKLIYILFLIFGGFNTYSQTDTILLKSKSVRIEDLKKANSEHLINNIKLKKTDTIIGHVNGPCPANDLGFSIIAGTESPNLGINIDYNPLFLKRIIGQVGYRTDFKSNQIFNSSLESYRLIGYYYSLDLKVAYDKYSIDNSKLNPNPKIF